MSLKSEEDIIEELVLKGEGEAEIFDYLQRHGMFDSSSIERVQSKIIEVKMGMHYRPVHPPRKKIRLYGIFLITIGIGVFVLFAGTSLGISLRRYDPRGAAFIIAVIGLILVIWPDEGVDNV